MFLKNLTILGELFILLEHIYMIKLLGTFGSGAHVDGFAHHMIFEVEDEGKVGEMDRDIMMGEVGQFIEDFQFHIGGARKEIEDVWKSS